MPFFAFMVLVCSFGLTLAASVAALPRGSGVAAPPRLAEKASLVLLGLLTFACFILGVALSVSDFSFLYVVMHTDRDLHLFYRLTALWGGQEGALLFWAWCAALCAELFRHTRAYAGQDATIKRWFWSVYFAIMGFFCLLLISWNNPFLAAMPVPADGFGLNPLLQNPGMIFHPPLLFLGYGAFTVPCCLALAALLRLNAARAAAPAKGAARPKATSPAQAGTLLPDWAAATRPFILSAWLLLGAGIILGGWWSYMELGWGGYWAWDPVENSSLVPWLVATACLHTSLVEQARGKLYRTNAFLMVLVTISAFFSTYLVRGGVIQSVHAFAQSDVGTPLLIFVLALTAFAAWAAFSAPKTGQPLDAPLTREGLLTCTAWVLLALSLLITLATMWPVISLIWSAKAVGLSKAFYNTACLPLFVLLAAFLALCPWVGWGGRVAAKGQLGFVLGVAVAVAAMLAYLGFARPLALAAAALAVAIMAGAIMLTTGRAGFFRPSPALGAAGVHFGFAVMLLGIAFSGPYKEQADLVLKPGQAAVFGDYTLTLTDVTGGDSHLHEADQGASGAHPDHATTPPRYIFSEAAIAVRRGQELQGELRPQLRRYASHPDKAFSEVDTLFSMGNELYASLLGVDEKGVITVQISANPLVNWVWAGGILLCLFPLLGLGRRAAAKGRAQDAPGAAGTAGKGTD